jgi:23S rRNA (uracil1939-C5)-methyltransferase
MEYVPLTLTDQAYLGSAIGRDDKGRVVFVPFGIPGERVSVKVTEEHKRWARAEIVEIHSPSQDRVLPKCQHFKVCGGCHYQHMPYPLQLLAKRSIVRAQLERLGGFTDPLVHSTVPSPSPWNTRNNIQFSLDSQGKLGFRGSKSGEVIPISECHLPNKEIADLWPQLDLNSIPGLKRLAVRSGAHGETMIVLVGESEPNIAIASDLPTSIVWTELDENLKVLAGDGHIHMSIRDREFRVSASSFFQIHTELASKLVEHVLKAMQIKAGDRILELYAGVGLFSAFLAEAGATITAVEQSPWACSDFEFNLDEFENVELYESPVEEALPSLVRTFDGILVDPPRSGLGQNVLDRLLEIKSPQIIYVSCDPTTLARDGKVLTQAGYTLEDVTPYDFFPQTYHIETISIWRRPTK